jgi:hypothetical protein
MCIIIFPDDAAGRDVRGQEEDNVGMSQPPEGPQLVEQWQTAGFLMKIDKETEVPIISYYAYIYNWILYIYIIYIYIYMAVDWLIQILSSANDYSHQNQSTFANSEKKLSRGLML